jgi:exopolysaccharide production protein ExoZ
MSVPLHYGSFGVDLFFVLSGFIIAYSADRNSRHFLVHRLIRVLPPYWVATLLGFLMCLLGMKALDAFGWFAQSLAFVTRADGRPPIIFVGWTLVYELAFYFLFAVLLRIWPRLAPLLCGVVLVFLAYGLQRTGLPLRPWPLLSEFAYGLLIFVVTKPLTAGGAVSRRLGAIPIALTAIGLVGLYWFEPAILATSGVAAEMQRVVVLGVPAAMIVLGLVLIEKRGWSIGASYAMYLLHPLVFAIVLGLKPGPLAVRLELFFGLAVVTVVLSLVYYWLVEVPSIRLLRRWLASDGPPVVQIPAEKSA